MIIETHDPEETFEVGRKIGMNAKPGQIYTLTGDLGVGKTIMPAVPKELILIWLPGNVIG